MSTDPDSRPPQSPLKMLASLSQPDNRTGQSNSKTIVSTFTIGTFSLNNQINIFQIYLFPSGVYYSVEQIAGFFFAESKAKFYNFLTTEAPVEEICKDINTHSIYISYIVAGILGRKFENPLLRKLSTVTAEQVRSNHVKIVMEGTKNLALLNTPEESSIDMQIGAYNPDKTRYKIC
jgi:hypothetical protein